MTEQQQAAAPVPLTEDRLNEVFDAFYTIQAAGIGAALVGYYHELLIEIREGIDGADLLFVLRVAQEAALPPIVGLSDRVAMILGPAAERPAAPAAEPEEVELDVDEPAHTDEDAPAAYVPPGERTEEQAAQAREQAILARGRARRDG